MNESLKTKIKSTVFMTYPRSTSIAQYEKSTIQNYISQAPAKLQELIIQEIKPLL